MKIKTTILLSITFLACKKEKIEDVKTVETLPGGKGGLYSIAVFPSYNKIGYAGKVYIRYGAKEQPALPGQYSDSSATMTEPGFTHHAHFFYLKEGYYAIKATCLVNGVQKSGDTTIEIKGTQPKSVDYPLNLR